MLISGPKGLYACYCLVSTNPEYEKRGSCYIGFTNHPQTRLRQHNKEIAGGAKRTARRGPWRMVLFVGGFPTKIAALKFEFIWTYPTKSQYANKLCYPGTTRALAMPRTITSTLNVLLVLLTNPPYAQQPLYVVAFDHGLVEPLRQALIGTMPVYLMDDPSSVQVEPGWDVVPEEVYASTHTSLNTNCPLCRKEVHKVRLQCPTCQSFFCMSCLARKLSDPDHLLPNQGPCPLCGRSLTWQDLLRNCTKRLVEERQAGPNSPDAPLISSPSPTTSDDLSKSSDRPSSTEVISISDQTPTHPGLSFVSTPQVRLPPTSPSVIDITDQDLSPRALE
ncbi:putative Structure-specific endonuclease subunit SLX1 [Giardia muris]|uniref:Structure-specific endonuclease subunit SLX1 homolog n=1 Tax=Giardia muris TaxID=5742 RepID=A0A4Z1T182_GIAMU|nr:putative Structure-specific endonuclease subunit SLX1 [Giardia muris]|eukprot:TNJ26687.1 putative Structure-specific endonuclease subunit SLX1 [Giardia muris]